ncbi:transmembrane protein 54b isoform X3 [Hoplias malabaricus]|uniref:transmembrane protein 54b isoform X3 n=1 Tax=Hoplias malabaricus TaxID=27720 RepID=UPI003462619D
MRMANSGLNCAGLIQPKSLMKIGLCMVLVGHVNFLLGALVHGTVLRHINLGAQTLEYAVANILALTAGLEGVIVGILAIVLSRNEKNLTLTWSVCVLSAVGILLAAASAVGLLVALVWVVIHGSKALLQCNIPDNMSYFSITDECPFDPTRIYVKTLQAAEPLVLSCHASPPHRYQGDGKASLPERPPERYELLGASEPFCSSSQSAQNCPYIATRSVQNRPCSSSQPTGNYLYSSTRSAQNQPPPARFHRSQLNRASFWI